MHERPLGFDPLPLAAIPRHLVPRRCLQKACRPRIQEDHLRCRWHSRRPRHPRAPEVAGELPEQSRLPGLDDDHGLGVGGPSRSPWHSPFGRSQQCHEHAGADGGLTVAGGPVRPARGGA